MDLLTPLLIVAVIIIYYFVSKAQTSEISTLKTHMTTMQQQMNSQGEMVKKIVDSPNLMDPEKYKKYVAFNEEFSKMDVSRLTNELSKIQNKYSDPEKPSTESKAFKKELAQLILDEYIKFIPKDTKAISPEEMIGYYASLSDAIVKRLKEEE